MNPTQKAAQDWEAKAIEKCRNDPQVAALGLCPSCLVPHPCRCERKEAIKEMRAYYEANRRTMFRKEPQLIGSWGVDMDGLMTGLFEIATRKFERMGQ
jgi:hypothetical protein